MNANLTYIQLVNSTTTARSNVNLTLLHNLLVSNINGLLTTDIQPAGSYCFVLPNYITSRMTISIINPNQKSIFSSF